MSDVVMNGLNMPADLPVKSHYNNLQAMRIILKRLADRRPGGLKSGPGIIDKAAPVC